MAQNIFKGDGEVGLAKNLMFMTCMWCSIQMVGSHSVVQVQNVLGTQEDTLMVIEH